MSHFFVKCHKFVKTNVSVGLVAFIIRFNLHCSLLTFCVGQVVLRWNLCGRMFEKFWRINFFYRQKDKSNSYTFFLRKRN